MKLRQCSSTALLFLAGAAAVSAQDLFVFHMDGSQEVPPVSTSDRGGCRLDLDEALAELTVTCTHTVAAPTAAHIHKAPTGVGGPIVFGLGDPTSPIEEVWSGMTAGEIADLQAGVLYVNVHTAANPGGEIRGQILPRTVDRFFTRLEGGQEVPPTGSAASGLCRSDLSDDATALVVSECVHDVFAPTGAHIHAAPAGVNGPIIFDFGDPTSPFSGTAPLAAIDAADLAGDLLYYNVHSMAFPAGEIRGQIARGPIFDDGFESGDIAAWTTSVP